MTCFLLVVSIRHLEALPLLVLVPALAIGPGPTPFEPIGARIHFLICFLFCFYIYISTKVGSDRSGRIAQGSHRFGRSAHPTPAHFFAVKCVARDGLARECLHLPSEPRDAAANRLANSSSFALSLIAFSLSLTDLVKSILKVSMSNLPAAPK